MAVLIGADYFANTLALSQVASRRHDVAAGNARARARKSASNIDPAQVRALAVEAFRTILNSLGSHPASDRGSYGSLKLRYSAFTPRFN